MHPEGYFFAPNLRFESLQNPLALIIESRRLLSSLSILASSFQECPLSVQVSPLNKIPNKISVAKTPHTRFFVVCSRRRPKTRNTPTIPSRRYPTWKMILMRCPPRLLCRIWLQNRHPPSPLNPLSPLSRTQPLPFPPPCRPLSLPPPCQHQLPRTIHPSFCTILPNPPLCRRP